VQTGIKIFLNWEYRIETMKENFHSINGDISMRACMFCGRNLFTSIHYRYCSTELHRKSDSLICYKCEQASKKGKLKSVIEKLRKVLKIRSRPRPLGSTVQRLFPGDSTRCDIFDTDDNTTPKIFSEIYFYMMLQFYLCQKWTWSYNATCRFALF